VKTFISNFSILESFAWTFLAPNFFLVQKFCTTTFLSKICRSQNILAQTFTEAFCLEFFFLSNLFLKALFRIVCINLVNFFICINHLCLNHVCWDISTVRTRTSGRPQISAPLPSSRIHGRWAHNHQRPTVAFKSHCICTHINISTQHY